MKWELTDLQMNVILREKRKVLGLTQEQVATYLGVTAPAVNKWEKGATCPDITLLPALARLLKTDPNTLLCFEESLTKQEITRFLNEAVKNTKAGAGSKLPPAVRKNTAGKAQCSSISPPRAISESPRKG